MAPWRYEPLQQTRMTKEYRPRFLPTPTTNFSCSQLPPEIRLPIVHTVVCRKPIDAQIASRSETLRTIVRSRTNLLTIQSWNSSKPAGLLIDYHSDSVGRLCIYAQISGIRIAAGAAVCRQPDRGAVHRTRFAATKPARHGDAKSWRDRYHNQLPPSAGGWT